MFQEYGYIVCEVKIFQHFLRMSFVQGSSKYALERKLKSPFSKRIFFRTCSFSLFCVCLAPFSNRGGFYLRQPKKQSEKISRGFPISLVLNTAEHLAFSQHNRYAGRVIQCQKKRQVIRMKISDK